MQKKAELVRRLREARDRLSSKRGRRIEGRKPYSRHVVARIRQLRKRKHWRSLEELWRLKAEGLKQWVASTGHENRALQRSWAGVAARLNEEGVPTKSGKPWTAGTVWAIAVREGIADQDDAETAAGYEAKARECARDGRSPQDVAYFKAWARGVRLQAEARQRTRARRARL